MCAPFPTCNYCANYSNRLAQILSGIIRDLYGVQKISISLRLQRATKLQLELQNWRASINSFFDLDPAKLNTIFAMQYTGLQLAYSQARILLHRPFVLQDPDSDALRGFNVPELYKQIASNTAECINAAIDIVNLIDAMYQKDKSFSSSWVSIPPSAILPQKI